jgi:hypothetical protein
MVELAAITLNGTRINGSVQDARSYSKFDRSAINMPDAPDFSFADLIDTVNPLQHIPVVSSIYRGITGDTIHPTARVAGDIIFGGVLGVASAAAGAASAISDSVMEGDTGKTVPGTMLAALLGEQEMNSLPTPPAPKTQIVEAMPPVSIATAPVSITQTSDITITSKADPVVTTAKPEIDVPAEASPDNLDHVLAQLAKSQNAQPANPAPTTAQTTLNGAKAYELPKPKMYPLDHSQQAYGGVIGQRSHPDNVAINNYFLPLKKIPNTSETLDGHPNPLPQQLIEDLRAMQADKGTGSAGLDNMAISQSLGLDN